jgi:cytochrome c-type biogenesis protein CcmE
MKRYTWFVVPALGLAVVLGGFLVYTISDDLVYYRTPSEVHAMEADLAASGGRLRLGGQVLAGSIEQRDGVVVFVVTDGHEAVSVEHRGTPQQLFREGIGVVLEGAWDGAVFRSDTMIIKHDEQYRTEDGGVYTPGSYSPEP